MIITINGQEFNIADEQVANLIEVLVASQRKLSDVPVGDTFKFHGFEFIRFPQVGNAIPAVMKECVGEHKFGETNQFGSSDVLEYLQDDVLSKIGPENVLAIKTDLTSVDGLKDYGAFHSQISLPTLEFYRNNVEIFDKYKLDCWWWLATPWSTPKHNATEGVACVSPIGDVYDYDCGDYDRGVRPFLLFESSILVS